MSRILIVEDNLDFAYGLRNNLEIEGYEVDVVADGREAVERVGQENYDLIILDLMIPGFNGYQVLRHVREAGHLTPVLILSAKDEPDDKVRGFRLGADDYVTKPFSLPELLARVESQIRKYKASSHTASSQSHLPSGSADLTAPVAVEAAEFHLPPPVTLTARETEVAALLQEGLTDKAMAHRLHISRGTVKSHVHNVLQKLHVRRRWQLRRTDRHEPDD